MKKVVNKTLICGVQVVPIELWYLLQKLWIPRAKPSDS